MDPLFFGPLEDAHCRYIVDGVVRGIAGYGNAVGVPTVGGQVTFDASYQSNPLVNVFCLGVLPIERLVLAKASGVGNLAVLLGARTGRDGIGGVSVLASAGFGEGEADAAKRPSVQVGDPFEEKRLIEACLQLLDDRLVVGIQDLGGAGLACATSEIAARGGVGLDVDVHAVARREPSMNSVEVMTSESQERMLAVVTPESLDAVQAVCARWEIEARVIGTVKEPDADGVARLRIREGIDGPLVAEVPAAALADDAPRYRRPMAPPADLASRQADDPSKHLSEVDCNVELLAGLLDTSWISNQYDHQLFLNTILGPGEADAALLKLSGPGVAWNGRALALSADANPAWCAIDPRIGTVHTVFESALNIACAGGLPLALVNCLNFGNPEHEEVMWQLSESIDGMTEACRALGLPVVGGNVSLYNESSGVDIDPTPVVVSVGLVGDLERRPPAIAWAEGAKIVMLGSPASGLAGSALARRHGLRGGSLDTIELGLAASLCAFVAELVSDEFTSKRPIGLVEAIHDVSDGGLAIALAEATVKSGVGCIVRGVDGYAELFSETPGRVLIATKRPEDLIAQAIAAGVSASEIGEVFGDRLVVEGLVELSLVDLEASARGLETMIDGTAR